MQEILSQVEVPRVDCSPMKTAIIGLPMVGKTSLFTILTGVHQETRVGSTAVRMGVAKVPDPRLDELARLFEPNKITHATVEYVDMPAISKESLRDPSYVASLRVGDAFAHVLRAVRKRHGSARKGLGRPVRDLEDVEIELILSDLVVIEKRMERVGQGSQEDQEPRAGPRIRAAGTLQGELEANVRCASWSLSPTKTKSASADFSFFL